MNIFLQKHLQLLILLILAGYIQKVIFQCQHVQENILLGKLFYLIFTNQLLVEIYHQITINGLQVKHSH